MISKQRKRIATILGICWVITALWWCQNKTETIKTTIDINETNTTIEKPSIQDSTSISEATNPEKQKLSINNRCIGCGHCTKIAKDTFSMTERKAQVISQENIDSMSVSQAIAHCPVQAISIIKT